MPHVTLFGYNYIKRILTDFNRRKLNDKRIDVHTC